MRSTDNRAGAACQILSVDPSTGRRKHGAPSTAVTTWRAKAAGARAVRVGEVRRGSPGSEASGGTARGSRSKPNTWVRVAFGSPCTPFDVASDTGVVNIDGSITMRRVWRSLGPRTHSGCNMPAPLGVTPGVVPGAHMEPVLSGVVDPHLSWQQSHIDHHQTGRGRY
jgi:hypothetical protein